MKRFLCLLTAALLTFTLASCGEPLFSPIETSIPESSGSSELDSVSVPESLPESSAESEPDEKALLGTAIPESTPRDASYLDDAILIGDSLTYGFSSYGVLPEKQVLANTGINPQTILTKACIPQNGTNKTVLDAAAALQPAKIYIMLGANGVAFLNFDNIIEWYGTLIDGLQEAHPDAKIYVQSILPITRGKEKEQENLTNERIRALNEQIFSLAEEKNCFYLNVAEMLADEEGYLPDELSADGMHFGARTYRKWVDYLLSHTVEGALE